MSPEETMDSQPTPEEEPKKRGPRKASEVIAETEERVRAEAADEIAALKAQIAAAEQKTADALQQAATQKAENESIKDQLAPAVIAEVDPEAEGAVTVNFVSDDCTILGKLWFRGEELTIAPGTKEWDELWDKKRNKSYLELTEDEQILVWGERKFRPGKWSGLSFEELLADQQLTDEERQELQSILNKRTSRSASPAGYTSSTSQKRSPVSSS